MEINKFFIWIITILSFVFLVILDIFNISQYIDYSQQIESTISNTITFISILIGFISTIYVMIQQSQDGYVFKLLQKHKLTSIFNKSFKSFVYIGFLNVIILIILNFFSNKMEIFKFIIYIVVPLSIYFLLISNNLITTICKIIISEDELKNKDKKIEEKDIINV